MAKLRRYNSVLLNLACKFSQKFSEIMNFKISHLGLFFLNNLIIKLYYTLLLVLTKILPISMIAFYSERVAACTRIIEPAKNCAHIPG